MKGFHIRNMDFRKQSHGQRHPFESHSPPPCPPPLYVLVTPSHPPHTDGAASAEDPAQAGPRCEAGSALMRPQDPGPCTHLRSG